ncbi:MAG TPA: hypothetical protein VFU43_12630 [Streptosporangiaceae bacterium]|nr:hypothetical protein [Streptosporangiaceae bacterium]
MTLEFPDLAADGGDLMFLLGIMFNQQIRAEAAWKAPARLRKRLGVLDVDELADADPATLAAVMRDRPMIHPFTTSMATYTIGICNRLIALFDARAENVWADHPDAVTLLRRLTGFPGIGRHKAAVAIALLIREYGIPISDGTGLAREGFASCPRLREVLTIRETEIDQDVTPHRPLR